MPALPPTRRCRPHTKACSLPARHCSLCSNLLPGTLEYNDKALQVPRVLPQSEQEVLAAIEKVLWAAGHGGADEVHGAHGG